MKKLGSILLALIATVFGWGSVGSVTNHTLTWNSFYNFFGNSFALPAFFEIGIGFPLFVVAFIVAVFGTICLVVLPFIPNSDPN